MSRELWVFFGGCRVARLEHERGELTLRYDASDGPSLSVRLPPRAEPYDDAACRPFFANLLPEGAWREALCRQLRIAPGDDFSLLAAIGEDCAGATVLSSDSAWTPARGRYVATTEEQLAEWVKHPAKRPSVKAAPGLRLSLAGAQDKLLIHLQHDRPHLCERGAPSTLIIKPDIRDPFSEIALSGLNELFSMRLAARAGLVVPPTSWFARAFAIGRYDRSIDGDRISRLHQEDFAQILGLPASAKYDVGWQQCFDVVTRYATTPAKARVQLIDRLLFDVIVGNDDAHGKNFALLHLADGTVELAPAYDILCTELYPSLSRELAMPIGPAKTRADLDREAWRELSSSAGISLAWLRRRAAELAEIVRALLDDHLAATERSVPALKRDIYPARRRSDLFDALAAIVRQNCDLLVRSFA